MSGSFIVAEAGVNNSGSLEIAKNMAKVAKNVGANAIKFQTFWNLGCLEEYEMSKWKWLKLKEYCDSIGIEFMTTAHWGSPLCGYKEDDYDVLMFVDCLVKRHKIASPYLVNDKYLEFIGGMKKPLLVSTGSIIHEDGMATMDEVEHALSILAGNDITLLHCISKYPPKADDYSRVKELKKFAYPVGISDHTTKTHLDPYPVIEKHFKLDENCIDAKVSLDPFEFEKLVNYIRYEEDVFSEL